MSYSSKSGPRGRVAAPVLLDTVALLPPVAQVYYRILLHLKNQHAEELTDALAWREGAVSIFWGSMTTCRRLHDSGNGLLLSVNAAGSFRIGRVGYLCFSVRLVTSIGKSSQSTRLQRPRTYRTRTARRPDIDRSTRVHPCANRRDLLGRAACLRCTTATTARHEPLGTRNLTTTAI